MPSDASVILLLDESVTVIVWASSSAEDTDFTATLVDVHPDGRAIVLTDGICRARFRDAAAEWTQDDLRRRLLQAGGRM